MTGSLMRMRKIGNLQIGEDVEIEEGAIIKVGSGFIGDRTIIRAGARIEGTRVELGTESYLDYGAWIGGGSCWDSCAYLKAGDWLHMGWHSQINIARGVDIGDEVAVGIDSKVFTHGAYPPADHGFPVKWGGVKLGNRVWLPNAWVNPGVTVGDNVVVASMSLVNDDLPAGCFAGGVPARVLVEGKYSNPEIKQVRIGWFDGEFRIFRPDEIIEVTDSGNSTFFNLKQRTITGPASKATEMVKNQFRRNGIRFRFYAKDGEYVPW